MLPGAFSASLTCYIGIFWLYLVVFWLYFLAAFFSVSYRVPTGTLTVVFPLFRPGIVFLSIPVTLASPGYQSRYHGVRIRGFISDDLVYFIDFFNKIAFSKKIVTGTIVIFR